MLRNKQKSITLNATAFVGDQPVMNLSATVPSNTGVGQVSQYVQNAELYNTNKTEARRDVTEFQNDVYEVEDEMVRTEEVVE
ncbi:hypothetical protein [Carnobacterium mobile]|uniref:hypothetical protein n=1 Tax=Carnobacterium mobile TaxID=2750 RepID=UPI00054E5A98|nr:hypothetical protein [Carnobacterium mobile]